MQWIENFDRQLFLVINGAGFPLMDAVMVLASSKYFWIWLYLLLMVYFFARYRYKVILILLMLIVSVALTDLLSVHALKNVVQRYRPCHHTELAEQVRLVAGRCGGMFGFVSSHAANTAGIFFLMIFLGLIRWKKNRRNDKMMFGTLLLYVLMNAYSRVYLGVHYPLDVLGGWLLAAIVAGFLALVVKKFRLFSS